MNKKAEEGGTGISGKIVALILMIAVVFVAYYLIASYYSSDPLGIFPDYILDENVVQYDGREKLLRPELVYYWIIGDDAGILLRYNAVSKKWRFKFEDWSVPIVYSSNYKWHNVDVSNRRALLFEQYTSFWKHRSFELPVINKNENFLKGLKGKNAEKGLEYILKRVVKNDEGNDAPWSDVQFKIGFGRDGGAIDFGSFEYDLGVSRHKGQLNEMNGLIIRINQRTKGYLK